MSEKFNRYNRYSRESGNTGNNQPPVTPKISENAMTPEQLRDEYEKREKEFRERLEERYGHNHAAGVRKKPDRRFSASNKTDGGLTGNKTAGYRNSAREQSKGNQNSTKSTLNGKKSTKKTTTNSKTGNRTANKNVKSSKKSGALFSSNKKKAKTSNNVSQKIAYRGRGTGGPSPEVILKARKLKAKKIRRAKMRRKIAVVLIIAVALGIFGNMGYKKLQSGYWLDENFMIEPAAELDYDKMKSEYVYLYNIDENRSVAGHRANDRMYPASLTKMMTAIVTIEKAGNPGNLNDTVKVPKYIMDKLAKENASIAGFVANEEVSYMDLLYGVMLPSGGDACLTIADQMFGSESAMVQAMNDKAKKLHMDGTHFVNTVGLHDPNHYSTARDMAKLMRYGLKNETFKKIISTEEYTTSITPEHPQGILMKSTVFKKIQTTKNIEAKYGSLIENDGYYADKPAYYDPSSQYNKKYENPEDTEEQYLGDNDMYIKGGKTGYTLEAHLCLASYGEIDGKNYILITGKAYGNPQGEPFNIYDALYAYGQVHQAHLDQEKYINDKLWRRMYVSLFKEE